MSWAARGLYRELMDECWIKGSVPSGVNQIAEMFGVDEPEITPLLPQIIRCFDLHEDGTMTSPFIEELRTEADARRVVQANRRLGKTKNGEPRLTQVNQTAPGTDGANLCEVEENRREEKEVPPTPKGAGRRPRRTSAQILSGFSPEAERVVSTLRPKWRKEDPNGREIKVDPAGFGQRIDEILAGHPELTPDVLIQAAEIYLQSSRQSYQAPQWFFGVGKDGHEAAWVGCVKLAQVRGKEVSLAL